MKIRIGIAVLACLLFVFGVNQIKECAGGEGAEVMVFKKNMAEYKEIIKQNSTIQSKEVVAAQENLQRENLTDEERNAAYIELTNAYGKMYVNDNRAKEALEKAIESLKKDADKYFDSGKEGKEEFGVEFKEFAIELTGMHEEVEIALTNMEIETPEGIENPEVTEMMNDTREMFGQVFEDMRESHAELIQKIDSLSGEGMAGENADSVVSDIKSTLVYANQVLELTRYKHLMEFKATAAVGKMKNVMGQMNKLMKEVFKGMEPSKYLEGIHNDTYDTSYMNFIMKNDLQKMSEKSGIISKDMRAKIRKSLKRFKMAPRPGSVNDGNPEHNYFYNSKKDRWFWVTKDEPTKKHWAPFDKEANTGKYIEFVDGQWYSNAPIYNGKRVKINLDSKTKPKLDSKTKPE